MRWFGARKRRSASRSTVSPAKASVFPIGAKVEVRFNLEGYIGCWLEAIVTDHVIKYGRLVKYKIKYAKLVKNDDRKTPETEEVTVDDVRPEAPRNPKNEFELHELVEGYDKDGWWYGVIFGLKYKKTGKYPVSFPISRELIHMSPSQIRPQLIYSNGKWSPFKPKPKKQEKYQAGDKVEVANIRDGKSWLPAIIIKIIGDNNFLINYQNTNLDEIVDITALRTVLHRSRQTSSNISNVEFLHEGGSSNWVMTPVHYECSDNRMRKRARTASSSEEILSSPKKQENIFRRGDKDSSRESIFLNLSLDDDLSILEEKLNSVNSLEREREIEKTLLTNTIHTKKSIYERDLKIAEKKKEVTHKYSELNLIFNNMDNVNAELANVRNEANYFSVIEKALRDERENLALKTVRRVYAELANVRNKADTIALKNVQIFDAELAEVRKEAIKVLDKEKRLKDERGRFLEMIMVSLDVISSLKGEIEELSRLNERERERHLMRLLELS